MVLKAVAHKINDIYGLKENENLTNEQRIEKVEKIIINKLDKKYDSADVKKSANEGVTRDKSKNIRWRRL